MLGRAELYNKNNRFTLIPQIIPISRPKTKQVINVAAKGTRSTSEKNHKIHLKKTVRE